MLFSEGQRAVAHVVFSLAVVLLFRRGRLGKLLLNFKKISPQFELLFEIFEVFVGQGVELHLFIVENFFIRGIIGSAM